MRRDILLRMARPEMLRGLCGREPCRLRATHGLVEVRRKGSHVIMGWPMLLIPSRYPCPATGRFSSERSCPFVRQSRPPRALSERAGALLKPMPTMTNAAALIPV